LDRRQKIDVVFAQIKKLLKLEERINKYIGGF
jgi:hypothetical protein